MKKQIKKSSITEEIEKLKQRREDRKNKNIVDKKPRENNIEGGNCDPVYERLIKSKKIAFNHEPEKVFYYNLA
jgi:hypothetical protein